MRAAATIAATARCSLVEVRPPRKKRFWKDWKESKATRESLDLISSVNALRGWEGLKAAEIDRRVSSLIEGICRDMHNLASPLWKAAKGEKANA